MVNEVELLFQMLDGEITEEQYFSIVGEPDYDDKVRYPHGRCVDYYHDVYHDVYIYEDGFEERISIGD